MRLQTPHLFMVHRKSKRIHILRAFLLFAAATLFLAACSDTPPVENVPPKIEEILADFTSLVHGQATRLVALAGDPNGDDITYAWSAGAGFFIGPDSMVAVWTAPESSDVFTIRVEVSDGKFITADSIDISVGQGTITVTSDPPGARITLDFRSTFKVTPYVFEGVAVGKTHTIQLFRNEIPFTPERIEFFLEEGQSKTAHFSTPPSLVSPLALGRDDILEIGTFAWSPFGNSFVYGANTAEHGVGIYNYDTAEGNAEGAILLTADVDINEPLVLYNVGSGQFLVWTGTDGTLLQAEMFDGDFDGIYLMGPTVAIHPEGYGAAVSEGKLLFSLATTALGQGFYWADLETEPLATWQPATQDWGRNASWKPGSPDFFVYEHDGYLLRMIRSEGTPPPPDTLRAQPPIANPTWGKRSIAYLNGAFFGSVSMQSETGSLAAELATGLSDVRDLEWNPSGTFLVVTHNPSGGQALKIESLPFP